MNCLSACQQPFVPRLGRGEPILSLASLSLAIAVCTAASTATAQIVPDATLPVNSLVTENGSVLEIEAGTRAGSNLFHSFDRFNVPTGSEAYFNNAANIDNIITRVTGGQLSNIDGLIRANGTADLFVVNPNGIRFGPNARLDIGGSFIGSTADRIEFADGTLFSATAPADPLLTVSVPVGLQFGGNSGPIRVEGPGHGLIVTDPTMSSNTILDRSNSFRGLQVDPGNTLALIGSDVNLVGGVLTAEGGHIELGSLLQGEAELIPNDSGWNFSYEGVEALSSVGLSQQASADASGPGSGSIRVVGDRISLAASSVLFIQNFTPSPSGSIEVEATEGLEVIGSTRNGSLGSSLRTEALGDGAAADIRVVTRQATFSDGGSASSKTAGAGGSGNITIEASESIRLLNQENPLAFSNITTSALFGSAGGSGNISIATDNLSVSEGASIFSGIGGTGNGGNVTVNADTIVLDGVSPVTLAPSGIASVAGGMGNAGNVTVQTEQLSILNGASISASTFLFGDAGNVTIDASDFVEVRGGAEESSDPSQIISSANVLDEAVREAFNLPPTPFGDSGNVTISTPQLVISDGAFVTVRNDGVGNGGSLSVTARSLSITDEGGLTASTLSGEGGNINLQVEGVTLMRRGGLISAEAGGTGNGGNLNINTNFLVALENSDIIVNAFEGNGGNIQITARGIFGTEFRQELTPESDITASSQFGTSGTVVINNPDVDANHRLVELSSPHSAPESVCQLRDSIQVPQPSHLLSINT